MIDKKTENSINLLIKKLKDENLGSLKFSNKTISIEISNNYKRDTLFLLPRNNTEQNNFLKEFSFDSNVDASEYPKYYIQNNLSQFITLFVNTELKIKFNSYPQYKISEYNSLENDPILPYFLEQSINCCSDNETKLPVCAATTPSNAPTAEKLQQEPQLC